MTFRTSASLAAIAAALTLTACGDGDSGSADPASQGRQGSAEDALAALGLAEQGRASWGALSVDGEDYTFTDFTLASEEGQLAAETLVLSDPRMSEQGPVFDRLALNTGELTYDEGLASFSALSIEDGGPGVGQALANLINGEGGFDSIPLERQTFSAMTLDTLRVTTPAGDDTGPGELVIARAETGGFDGEVLERLSITDIAYDATQEGGQQIALDLAEFSGRGVNLAMLDAGAAGEMASNPLIGGAAAGFDQYDTIAMTGLRVVAGGLRVLMPEFSADIEEGRGETLISTAVMPSLTLEPNPDSPDAAAFTDALSRLGYETMAFSFASETEYDPGADRVTTTGDNFLAMTDGFMMRFEQDVSGVQAYADAYRSWLEAGGDPETGPPAEILEPLMIRSGEIRLEDRSLLDRALAMMAEQQGATPAQLRSQAGLFVAMGAAMAGESLPPALVEELSGSLTRFISEGGVLVMAYEPDEPVSAARFMGEGGPDLEGLTVRHEPAE